VLTKNEVSRTNYTYTSLHLLAVGFYCILYTEPRVSLAVAVTVAVVAAVVVVVVVVAVRVK